MSYLVEQLSGPIEKQILANFHEYLCEFEEFVDDGRSPIFFVVLD